MITWDDRKRELSHALAGCAEGDTSAVWAVAEAMQSEIDRLGGKVLNTKETKAVDEHIKLRYFKTLAEVRAWATKKIERGDDISMAYGRDVLALVEEMQDSAENVHWEWDIQYWDKAKGVWVGREWRDLPYADACRYWADFSSSDRVPYRLVYRVVTEPIVYEGGESSAVSP